MANAAGIWDITVTEGSDYSETWTYYEADGVTPVNLTGWTGRAQIRQDVADRAASVLTTPTVTLGGTAGTVTMTIPASATESLNLSNDKGAYDIELVSGGSVQPFLRGAVYLVREVTR